MHTGPVFDTLFQPIGAAVCLVLIYKRPLSPKLWVNIAVFFPPYGIWWLVHMLRTPADPHLVALGLLGIFAVFVALAYAGVWIERRFGGDQREL